MSRPSQLLGCQDHTASSVPPHCGVIRTVTAALRWVIQCKPFAGEALLHVKHPQVGVFTGVSDPANFATQIVTTIMQGLLSSTRIRPILYFYCSRENMRSPLRSCMVSSWTQGLQLQLVVVKGRGSGVCTLRKCRTYDVQLSCMQCVTGSRLHMNVSFL